MRRSPCCSLFLVPCWGLFPFPLPFLAMSSSFRPCFPPRFSSSLNVHHKEDISVDLDYILDPCCTSCTSPSISWTLVRHLRNYQRKGISFLYNSCFHPCSSSTTGSILGDEMGLGKTVQVIGLISALLGKKHEARVDEVKCRRVRYGDGEKDQARGVFLIVCPLSVLRNWQEEFQTWGYFVVGKYYKKQKEQTIQLAR